MTKLEDVETHLTKTDHDTWFILYAELMTRAVRQLGALVIQQGDEEWRDAEEGYLDPDVLELLS